MALIKLQGESIHYEFDPEDRSSILGKGGMGVVFKGKMVHEDRGNFEYVAIKVLFKDLSHESIKRARREASIQITHENIVRMYGMIEIAESDGSPKHHVISEYLDGRTLDKLLIEKGALSQSEAIGIVKNVLSALFMLHGRGFIHRDIDPTNIMICSDGKIKIIDFGIAKQLNEYHDEFKQGTQEGMFIGKINYASPEQADGKHWMTNATSDIYSTGILMFELLTGRLPFTGSTYEIIKGHREQSIPQSDSLSPDLKYVINKATAKLQIDRYQSASEFIVDLEKIEKGQRVIPKPKKRWITISSIAFSLILLLVGSMLYSISHRNKLIEDAKSKLTIGLYTDALNLFRKAGKPFYNSETRENVSMLELLVPAVEAYNQSNYQLADSLFHEVAKLNSSDAYYYLGEMSYEGIGVPKNFKQGFKYTSQATSMGNKLAEYRLGLVYDAGIGVPADKNKALQYFENSGKVIDEGVNNKTPELLFIKGNMYLNGNYVHQNTERGLKYFTDAAEMGYPQAQYELYRILKDKDNKKALEWLNKSAKQGYPKAEYELGRIKENEQKYKEAYGWMLKAAAKNYSPAFQRLGLYYNQYYNEYADLFGIVSNNSISHQYTLKALEFDFENFLAMFDLWIDYSKGNGVEKDLAVANKYYDMTKSKLNELPYEIRDGKRDYESSLAQEVWNKIQ